MFKVITFITVLTLISGCGTSINADKYQTITPTFDPYIFFNGKVKAWGIVQNRSGDLVQRFTVDIDGSIDSSNVLTLDETFHYEVGEGVAHRVWKISSEGNNKLQGSAGDILGLAEGNLYGNAMRWQYTMDLPVDDTSYKVEFDDWIWSFNDSTIVNRSYIKKFGLTMAEVTIFMQQIPLESVTVK
ncbi:hypothetical protein PSECIP111951_03193 [Pseudoalteromonas holothuriae]|uniref:DUF3833 domain-containing protein n=1 Tax=Pseudoalteromonas holothuriae TaxID=2963714 RepID=A0A9W4W221_9GAMM|nr:MULTISPECIES: DUF3833 domain-containing protein [unclassified Pseudoalteromonas]CAH9063724.1 hypothetical protein PSECIP111854_03280 [Pseudoalteromonas sp. CIP111854]CAH9064683.1 hypothetical protein PSECIP111951_03193 [Pseudoalteromonas sp. CIP111951]